MFIKPIYHLLTMLVFGYHFCLLLGILVGFLWNPHLIVARFLTDSVGFYLIFTAYYSVCISDFITSMNLSTLSAFAESL